MKSVEFKKGKERIKAESIMDSCRYCKHRRYPFPEGFMCVKGNVKFKTYTWLSGAAFFGPNANASTVSKIRCQDWEGA